MSRWFERRPLDPPGFGVVAFENRVTEAATAPAPEAIQVADDAPEHDWETGRQWLPDGGPVGLPEPPVGTARGAGRGGRRGEGDAD